MAKKPPGKSKEEKRAEASQLKAEKIAAREEVKRLAAEDKARKAAERARLKTGDNSKEMPDAERQTLFLTHVDMRKRLDAEQKTLDKKKDEAKAAAKNDGFTKKMLDFAVDGDDAKKDARIRREVQELMQVAQWMGSPINTQFNLFGAAPPKSQEVVVDQAHAEGRAASAEGRPRHVPVHYPPGTDAFNAWLDAFDTHQRELHGHVGRGRNHFSDANRETIADGDRMTRGEKPPGEKSGDKIPAPTSGTAVTRSEYEKGLAGLGEQTKRIITDAGGTPPASSSGDLGKEQGIPED